MDFKKYLTPKYLLIGGIAVVGGLFLASKFRPKTGGSDTDETAVIATPISQPYAVDSNPPEYAVTSPATPGTSQGDKPVPMPTQPPAAHRTNPSLPPIAIPTMPPTTPHVPVPTPPLPGAPRRDTPPVSAPGAPPSTPNVPGGFPADCRDVQHRPSDYPGADITSLVRSKGGGIRALDIVLEWTLLNVAPPNVPLGLSRFAAWASNPLNHVFINTTRRSRGLRALTKAELERYGYQVSTLNAQHAGRDDKLSQADVQTLWNTWNVPYLCG